MTDEKSIAPVCLYAVHPGQGQCGLRGMKKEGFVPATGEFVYRCGCSFQWHLTGKEIAEVLTKPRRRCN